MAHLTHWRRQLKSDLISNSIINQALSRELHEIDPAWEQRAQRAWNLLMMVILEMLARAYGLALGETP